jgi:hypothetical protein
MLPAPLLAEQGSIVTPIVGPMTMGDYAARVNAGFLALQTCNSGTTAPTNGPSSVAVHYQCWGDTSASPVISFKFYDSGSWVTFGQLNTSTHVWTPFRNGAPIVAVATSGSAADLTTGTLPAARLPAPTASTLGGVQSKTCSASQWLNEISTSGVPNCAQPNFTDVAGTAALAQLPAFSGMSAAASAADADTFPTNQGAGNLKQTLAAIKTWIKAWIVKADVGLGNVDNTSDVTKWGATKTLTNTTYNCGSTGNVCTVRLASDITGFGTGVAAALGVNIGSAGAPVLFNGAGGTPSSIVLTNATGTAPGLTAGNVTTNANLTGEVTSVGNVTTVTNSSVIAKLLSGFTSGAGAISSSDSILSAFQKIVGNDALKAPLARNISTGCGLAGGGDLSADRTIRLSLTINAQSGSSYTVQDSDCGKLISLNNASAVAVSLPQANGSTFISGWSVDFQNRGAGTATITPVTSTINGGGSIALSQNQGMHCDSDGANYTCVLGVGAGGGSGTVTQVVCGSGLTGGTITASGTCALDPISAFETGDAKLTFKTTASAGWILCDDGSIGNASSGATTRANSDTAALFTVLYNAVTSLVVQDSSGSTVSRGASAAADYAANRRLVIPKALGRSLAIAGSGSGLTARVLGSTAGSETETPTLAKTANHDHSTQISRGQVAGTASYAYTQVWSGPTSDLQRTEAVGSGSPLNILDPRVHLNILIKL